MINCDKFVSLFTDYLDGILPGQIKSEFNQHLTDCRECTDRLRQMKALKHHLKKLNPVKTSDIFHVVLRSRIRRELDRHTFAQKIGFYFQTYKVPAFATGTVALILISFLSFYTFFNSENPAGLTPLSVSDEQAGESLNSGLDSRGNLPRQPDYYYVVEQNPIADFIGTPERINSEALRKMRESDPAFSDNVQNPLSPPAVISTVKTSLTF